MGAPLSAVDRRMSLRICRSLTRVKVSGSKCSRTSPEILNEGENRSGRRAVTNDPRVKVECRNLFETPPHGAENPFVVVSERAAAEERQQDNV
jgi:hypothetical protein